MFTRLITSAHKTGEGKGVGLISIRGKTAERQNYSWRTVQPRKPNEWCLD